MKKRNLKMIALTMAFLVSATLGGCAASVSAEQEQVEQAYDSSDASSVNSTSMAEGYESNEVISVEEQKKAEEIRRSEIAEQYSIYEQYGMIYDEEKDRFFYNGQMIRYFKDEVSVEHTNSFFFEDGVVDVEPIKDINGNLTGLKQSSDTDFNARTEKQDAINAEFNAVGITENGGSFELGDPNYRDDSLDTYTAFGVSYDPITQKWTYDGKIIHILYDADHNTYCDAGASDGINLKVVRDKNGNIETLTETNTQELEQYVK